MGDPASIGPEISLKALNNKDIYNRCRPIIIGDASVMKKAIEYTEKNSISMENLTSNIANSTGQLVSDLIKEQNIRNMIVFGGDTLIGILKNIECQYIIPVSEIFPGVVFTKAVGKETAINVITKAGGFGEENIIERINEFLENHSI